MLGTNDLKARFQPGATRIAGGIGQLARLALRVPAGGRAWEDETPPKLGVIVPPPLPLMAEDPKWDTEGEWRGGRAASLGLLAAVRADPE